MCYLVHNCQASWYIGHRIINGKPIEWKITNADKMISKCDTDAVANGNKVGIDAVDKAAKRIICMGRSK